MNFHLHLLDGSEMNDHRSIIDLELSSWEEAEEEAKTQFKAGLELEVEDYGDGILVYPIDNSFESGYEYAVQVTEN